MSDETTTPAADVTPATDETSPKTPFFTKRKLTCFAAAATAVVAGVVVGALVMKKDDEEAPSHPETTTDVGPMPVEAPQTPTE